MAMRTEELGEPLVVPIGSEPLSPKRARFPRDLLAQ